VMPLMAQQFGGNAATYGTMMALIGVGSLGGALWVAHFGRASSRVMLHATTGLGVAMTGAALAPSLALELAVLPLVGLTSMVLLSMATAVCNEETTAVMRGRVMALFSIAFLGSTPIGGPLIGWVSELVSPRAGIGIGAVACLATAAVALALRRHTPADAEFVAVTPADIAFAESPEAA